jgi:hypothetical protein
MNEYRVKSGQSLYDVSVQLYGDTSHVVDLLKLNTDLTVNSNLQANQVLKYENQNTVLTNYLATNSLNLATSTPKIIDGEDYNDDYNEDYN